MRQEEDLVSNLLSKGGDGMNNLKKRGFGSMDKEKQRAIASKGGKAAHASGKAHKWTSETARAAGILGRAKQRKG